MGNLQIVLNDYYTRVTLVRMNFRIGIRKRLFQKQLLTPPSSTGFKYEHKIHYRVPT